jgi:PAS domain S-box-containing protein
MKSFLGAPITRGDERLGNLYLTEKNGGAEFSQWDEDILVLFAAQAASAIRNARLYGQAEAQRKNLETLVNTSPVGVMVVDAKTGTVLLMNQEAQRVRGITHRPGDHVERHIKPLKILKADGLEYPEADLPLMRALRKGETVVSEEIRLVRPDGSSTPTLVNATPLYGSDGKVASAVVTIQDIYPLEEIEKLRNEFLGIVSHELRTPLTAIKGSAAIALGTRTPLSSAETTELFEIINDQADRLRDLVANLLDMTRIEAGTLSVSPEPANLMEMLDEAKANFARTGGKHALSVEAPAAVASVKADKRRAVQVLNNLLTNAAKYSPSDAPILVRIEPGPEMVTVRVVDKGRGIPADKLPHLFKKFSRLHGDEGGKVTGTGLGLAICKGIVEAHGGRIWVESAGEGKGSTFSFTLPVTAEAAKPDVTRRGDHMGRVHRAGERTRIVAVDDEPQVLRHIKRILEDAGYNVSTTSSSEEALQAVGTQEPDMVLLDLMMPGITGIELLKRIREFSGVPVIFLTGSDRDEHAVNALKAGADDYITKPFSPSELMARIEAALRRRVLSDQVEVRPPYRMGDLTVNFAERLVKRGEIPIALSATEYKILYELATNAGRVLTHEQLLQRVWGPEYSGETELVRSFIRNLRRKLGDDARQPKLIFTEPQVGYRMPKPTA